MVETVDCQNNGSDTTQPIGYTVPIPAIKWILHNNCKSNVELAALSNVCKTWRDVCSNAVVGEAISSAGFEIPDISLLGSEGSLAVLKESHAHDRHHLSTLTAIPKSLLRELFLTEMARELLVQQANIRKADTKQSSCTDGKFCLAWFAPSGIQITGVSPDDGDNDEESDVFKFNFAALRSEIKDQAPKKVDRQSDNLSVSCCREWRGYRHATEVLTPFGFATSFIRDVLDASVRVSFGTIQSETKATSPIKPTLTRSNSEMSQSRLSKISSLKYNPTFSVRGATLARPEGYCLCLDDEYITQHISQQKPGCIDSWMDQAFHELTEHKIKVHNETLSPRQRAKKQSVIARALLPRIVMSTKRKTPIMHRFAAENADADKGHRDASIHDPHKANESTHNEFTWEKRQRAVQFLNYDRSQAVRLITPPFSCGGIQGPITMFVVAITTEDGCFVSGRKSRFEFGHMYPVSHRDMMIDCSPVCIATGNCDADAETSCSSDDSDQSGHCFCNFDSSDPFNPNDLTINDPSEDCIHRGTIGPGLWHCYCAVFDGQSSFIRVDGEEEPKQTSQYKGPEGGNDPDSSSNAGKLVGSGVLDGLTLGSDHHFDMSLCYGEIDGECGQGAISELAVFKGRMDLSDVKRLENYLMKKHGIASAQKQRNFIANKQNSRSKPVKIGNRWEEDEWRRQAHALITQRHPWDLVGDPVPLRVASNHNSVAWQRVDDISGMPMRVSRIGHKTGNGSSDW